MAKSENQKLKLLYIADYLRGYTDERHTVTVQNIISHLERNGIKAERKSIYDDLETLKVYGLDIVMERGRNFGYYLASRDFELAELKLLVDSVQSSKFITKNKTMKLIKKLEGLTSVYEAGQLQRQVYVADRIKRDNESVYYNIDGIHRGISSRRKITFKYFEYSVKKERVYRNAGEKYKVTPIALTWDNDYYYLVAYDPAAGFIKHFRCDKMTGIEMTEEPADSEENYIGLDMAAYSKKVFGMFSGNERKVTLQFENRLAGAAIDRFGKEIAIIGSGESHFIINVNVIVSPQFFGWLLGFGTGVQITAPEDVVAEMRDYVASVSKLYCGDENPNYKTE